MNDQNNSMYSQPAQPPVYHPQTARLYQQPLFQQPVSGAQETQNTAPYPGAITQQAPAGKPAESPEPGAMEIKPKKKKKKKRTARDYAISLLIKLGVTAAVVALLLAFVCGIYVCHNNSSYPMIKDGDLCLTSKLSTLGQGDEIAYVTDDGIAFGRVIAFGGDSVDILDGYITVNGAGIYENVVYPTDKDGASISFPYTVPGDSIFVLNDFRSDISDSRTFGGVEKASVRGKVVMIMRRRGI